MKTLIKISASNLTRRLAIVALAFSLLSAMAPVHAEDKKESKEDLTTLKELLAMPKEDLKRVRLSLESIEKMSPSDRKKALQRIQDLNKMPSEQRKETIDRWNELSPELKKQYFDYLRKLSAGERTKFKALPWDKQIAQIKKTSKK